MKVFALIQIKDREKFLEFETQAFKIMKKYGVEVLSIDRTENHKYNEIHVLNFKDMKTFNAYRADIRFKELFTLRHEAIKYIELIFSDSSIGLDEYDT